MESRHAIENGKTVFDTIDNERYHILDMTAEHVTLRHVPKGRRKQKEDWRLSWDLFQKKCKLHELRVDGYGINDDQGYSDEYYILELVVKNIIQEIQLIQTNETLSPYKEKYERINKIRLKRRKQLNETILQERRKKKKALEEDISREKQRNKLQKEADLLNDMAEAEFDNKKSNQLKAEAEYIQEKIDQL